MWYLKKVCLEYAGSWTMNQATPTTDTTWWETGGNVMDLVTIDRHVCPRKEFISVRISVIFTTTTTSSSSSSTCPGGLAAKV